MTKDREPVSVADLERRLALCKKYGVRTYRDGQLSIDLTDTRGQRRKDDDGPLPESLLP